MLLELGLPSFDTLIYNSRVRFGNQVQCSQNSIIAQLRLILWFVCFSSTLCLCVSCLLSLSLLFYLIYGLVPEINYCWWWLIGAYIGDEKWHHCVYNIEGRRPCWPTSDQRPSVFVFISCSLLSPLLLKLPCGEINWVLNRCVMKPSPTCCRCRLYENTAWLWPRIVLGRFQAVKVCNIPKLRHYIHHLYYEYTQHATLNSKPRFCKVKANCRVPSSVDHVRAKCARKRHCILSDRWH